MPLAARVFVCVCALRHGMHVLTFSEDSDQSVDGVFVTVRGEHEYMSKQTRPLVCIGFCLSLNDNKNAQKQARLARQVAALTSSSVRAGASCRSASCRQRGGHIRRGSITPVCVHWYGCCSRQKGWAGRPAADLTFTMSAGVPTNPPVKPAREGTMSFERIHLFPITASVAFEAPRAFCHCTFCFMASRDRQSWLRKD